MPHQRSRHLLPLLRKQAAFWPVVGVLGLRQVGKTTLFRDQLGISSYLSFDDEDTRGDAEASAKSFLAKQETPLVIDEAQKVPALFDAIKSSVDRKRVPGRYYLTGSSAFTAQKDIQESLTGRIGLCELFPLTLAEAEEKEFSTERLMPIHSVKPRFGIERFSAQLSRGGLPVPMFSRDNAVRIQYWKNWLSTTLGRDLARVYGKGYDADFAEKVLFDVVRSHQQGIFPSVADFKYDARKTKKYLNAFRAVFVLRMLPCHEAGKGRDLYFLADSGMAHALMSISGSRAMNETTSLVLTRILILNEIFANTHYADLPLRWSYYKSSKGTPIDLVWDQTPIKIVGTVKQLGWEERAVHGAMKALGAVRGLIVAPTDHVTLSKKEKIGQVPWTFWS